MRTMGGSYTILYLKIAIRIGSLAILFMGFEPKLNPSRATFPILFGDPSFQETIKHPGTQLVFERTDG